MELVGDDGRAIAIGGPTQRAVLALLALAHGRVVSADELLESVWPGDGPPSGTRTLQSVISRLRAALATAGGGTITATGGGYALELPADALDVDRVAHLSPAAALALWRGDALAEFADLVAFAAERGRLAEWRWSLVEAQGDALLAAGRHGDVAAQWLAHVSVEALRGRLWTQLMTALAATDRQAEALRIYQRAREAYAEAGLDPPAEVVDLERQILAGAPVAAPQGDVAFLFTDVVGSTHRWEADAAAMAVALAEHDEAVNAAVMAHGGRLLKAKGEGDSTVSVFASAAGALAAAAAAQLTVKLPVRMAVHFGPVEARGGDFYGPTLNRAARLRAIAHGGQIICSQVVAEAAAKQLPDGFALIDLGTHRLKDLADPEHVSQLCAPGLPADFPPLLSLNRAVTNLPAQTSVFIGREVELDRVREMLAASRLVTLTGAGGSGKTRLAMQAGADLLDQYPDGVWLAELAPISESVNVANVIAAAANVQLFPGVEPGPLVVGAFAEKAALLILDNCEHVIDGAAAMVTDLLGGCPNLTILATSRERLRVAGESTWPIPTLELNADPNCEAMQLFCLRAAEARPGFVLDDSNRDAILEICKRVDAIPLAIELAAARVRVLQPTDLLARLNSHRDVLTGGDRTALPRQRSLRATIDWSYSLLSETEQLVLQRLAVFRGGWTLAAAEQVVTGDGIDELDALDILQELVDKSLVSIDHDADRYYMLETVREYALEQLEASTDADTWCRRHADNVVALLTQLTEELLDGRQEHALTAAAAEHDNIFAALNWAFERDHELVGQLVGAAFAPWYATGEPQMVDWFRQAAPLVADWSPTTVARAGMGAGTILGYFGEKELGIDLLERSIAAARELEDSDFLAMSLAFLGALLRLFDDLPRALPLIEEAVAIPISRERRLVRVLVCMRGAWVFGDSGFPERARELSIEAVETAVAVDDHLLLNEAVLDNGFYAPGYLTEDESQALRQKALDFNPIGYDVESTPATFAGRAWECIEAKDYEGALANLDRALSLPQSHWRQTYFWREQSAILLVLLGRAQEGKEMLESLLAEGVRTEVDRHHTLFDLATIERELGNFEQAVELYDRCLAFALSDEMPLGGWGSPPAALLVGAILRAIAALNVLQHGVETKGETAARQLAVGVALDQGDDWDELYLAFQHTLAAIASQLPPGPPEAAEIVATKSLRESVAYAMGDDRWLSSA